MKNRTQGRQWLKAEHKITPEMSWWIRAEGNSRKMLQLAAEFSFHLFPFRKFADCILLRAIHHPKEKKGSIVLCLLFRLEWVLWMDVSSFLPLPTNRMKCWPFDSPTSSSSSSSQGKQNCSIQSVHPENLQVQPLKSNEKVWDEEKVL